MEQSPSPVPVQGTQPPKDELPNSVPEPNVVESSAIKAVLMGEIQKAWVGQKTAKEALVAACADIESILSQYYK